MKIAVKALPASIQRRIKQTAQEIVKADYARQRDQLAEWAAGQLRSGRSATDVAHELDVQALETMRKSRA